MENERVISFLRFIEYSVGRQWLTTGSENWSSIKDRLIRYAAKFTSDYAGDIYYYMADIDEIATKAMNERNTGLRYEKYLGFRECGVNEITEYTEESEIAGFIAVFRFRMYSKNCSNFIMYTELNRVRYLTRSRKERGKQLYFHEDIDSSVFAIKKCTVDSPIAIYQFVYINSFNEIVPFTHELYDSYEEARKAFENVKKITNSESAKLVTYEQLNWQRFNYLKARDIDDASDNLPF